MSPRTIEETVRLRAEAVVTNDFGTSLRLMTHDAFGEAMELGVSDWEYTSYEMEPVDSEGDDRIFLVTFIGGEGQLVLRDRYRQINGEWMLADIELVE